MTRIRQLVLSAVLALVVSLSFASVASADPKDTGFERARSSPTFSPPLSPPFSPPFSPTFSATSADPKDGGFQP